MKTPRHARAGRSSARSSVPELSPSCRANTRAMRRSVAVGFVLISVVFISIAPAGGGALPVIMSITRSSRNPRLPQLKPRSARYRLRYNLIMPVHVQQQQVVRLRLRLFYGCFPGRLTLTLKGCERVSEGVKKITKIAKIQFL